MEILVTSNRDQKTFTAEVMRVNGEDQSNLVGLKSVGETRGHALIYLGQGLIGGVSSAAVNSANSRQVAGNHYKKGTGNCPECGAVIQHWDLYAQLPYLEAQIAKYTLRWRDKNGIQDLEKARHFLDKLIEVAKQQEAAPTK